MLMTAGRRWIFPFRGYSIGGPMLTSAGDRCRWGDVTIMWLSHLCEKYQHVKITTYNASPSVPQETTLYRCTVRINEPVGVIGIACPDEGPLLAFVSLFALAVVRGNTIIIVPSEKYPLSATDLYQVRREVRGCMRHVLFTVITCAHTWKPIELSLNHLHLLYCLNTKTR